MNTTANQIIIKNSVFLRTEDAFINRHLKEGMTGLELEAHRIDRKGHLSQTLHPFPGNAFIDRDFGEDQMEINTPPFPEISEALNFLHEQLRTVHRALSGNGELLWPFSNPPILDGEDRIPVARYEGAQLPGYNYRLHLAERYGKYKMTFSGIHFNYSFPETLLKRNFVIDPAGCASFAEYRDHFYLKLAEKALAYSWACVALLAASPLVDNSFFEAGKSGKTLFTGFSSLRCSAFGYWNQFVPLLSYSSMREYVDSIRQYIDQGLLIKASELYYPVRIKPDGKYTLEALSAGGINHIELRMMDLNPMKNDLVDIRDLEFLKLLLIWLAAKDMPPLTQADQIQALENHKSAASYDWTLAHIVLPGKRADSLLGCLTALLTEMKTFFKNDPSAESVLAYESGKLYNKKDRYAAIVRREFESDYINEGLRRARSIQESFNV